MTNYVTADQLKAMLSDGGELALLDVREEGAHSQSHLFYAAPMPLSVLELLAEPLVPRRGTRVVLVDAGGGLADRAAAKLADLGYTGCFPASMCLAKRLANTLSIITVRRTLKPRHCRLCAMRATIW